MLKGLLEGCILEIIRQEETYAYVISKELAKCGFGEISEGTIYPIILRLQKKELISATTKESESGPARKYYKLTEEGERELTEFKGNWSELNTAVNQLLSIRSE
jgi:PadR family transcriptional regulator PadR